MNELFESSYLSAMSEMNNKLREENQQLKEIITEARKYVIIELLDDNLEWHRNNYSNITGSDLPNDVILKIVDILEKVGEIE